VDLGVDNRLYHVNGARPHRLTRNEVPALTRALMGIIRRQAFIDRHVVSDVPCIRIHNNGKGINILVRSDDWAKLLPYLKDGTLDLELLPVEQPCVLNPNTYYDPMAGDVWDPELYARISTLLNTLFTIEFPTSNL
jgi:hypothetical protein